MTQLMTVYGLAFLNLPVIQGLEVFEGKDKMELKQETVKQIRD